MKALDLKDPPGRHNAKLYGIFGMRDFTEILKIR